MYGAARRTTTGMRFLVKDHSVTQQQYEQALAAKQTAERQLESTGRTEERCQHARRVQ